MNIYYSRAASTFCRDFDISKSAPYKDIPKKVRGMLMYGTTEADEAKYGAWFEGVIPNLQRRWKNTESEWVKNRLHGYMSEQPCKACKAHAAAEGVPRRPPSGGKNIQDARAGLSIHDVTSLAPASSSTTSNSPKSRP